MLGQVWFDSQDELYCGMSGVELKRGEEGERERERELCTHAVSQSISQSVGQPVGLSCRALAYTAVRRWYMAWPAPAQAAGSTARGTS